MEVFNVYSFRLMKYLDERGYKFIGTKQCKEDCKKTIFIYEDSVDLRNEVGHYTNKWKEKFLRG